MIRRTTSSPAHTFQTPIGLIALLALVALSPPGGYSQNFSVSAVSVSIAAKAPPGSFPKSLADVLKLSKSGVEEGLILAYVKGAPSLYNLSAVDVLHLTEAGLSSRVITAMGNHDDSLRDAAQPATTGSPPREAMAAPQLVDDAPVRVYAEPSLLPQTVAVSPVSFAPDYHWGHGYRGRNPARLTPGWRSHAGSGVNKYPTAETGHPSGNHAGGSAR